MVEYIIKRVLVTAILALAVSYALLRIEHHLTYVSDEIKENGLLEHRVFQSPNEVYATLDELDLNHLFSYLAYQFVPASLLLVF